MKKPYPGKGRIKIIQPWASHEVGESMPRTLNLKKVLSTELSESGLIGGEQQFDVEITCRRGGSPEFSELVRVVMPIEAWMQVHKTIESYINRQIARAEYLKGLMR